MMGTEVEKYRGDPSRLVVVDEVHQLMRQPLGPTATQQLEFLRLGRLARRWPIPEVPEAPKPDSQFQLDLEGLRMLQDPANWTGSQPPEKP